MNTRCLWTLLLFSLLLSTEAHAQKTQVPLDQDGEVQVITADMERDMNLFPEYDGFQTARLFRTDDGSLELVITYRPGEEVLRETEQLTSEEAASLRNRVSKRLTARGRSQSLNQEGRYELLATTTSLGLYYGSALQVLTGQGSPSLSLLGASAGFFVPFLATQNVDVTEAQATMTSYGGTQGFVHGLLVSALIGESTVESTTLLSVGLSASEAMLGYTRADDWGLTAGTAEVTSYGSSYGLGYGLAATALLIGDDPGEDLGRLFAAAGLVGTLAGSYGGYAIAQTERFTQGDARIMALGGLEGTLLGITALTLTDAQGHRPIAGTLIASSAVGLLGGRLLVRDRNFTEYQGLIVSLGTGAGSLVGLGLVAGNGDADSGLVIGAITLGTALGFGVTYASFAGEARTGGDELGMRLNVNPIGAATSALTDVRAPTVTLQASF